jgi:hypothetical protein
MALRSVISTLALAALMAAPAGAQQRERHRQNDNRSASEQPPPARAESAQGDRAIARTEPRQNLGRNEQPRATEQRVEQSRRSNNNNSNNNNNGRYDNRGYGYGNNRRYDSRHNYYYYYGSPRIIRPTVIRVAPYRPYVYRPSYSLGVYYGSGGYYPYGYTPRGYYEPIPGRVYGGVRITGAPRDARVFADGYFVGLVDDFDGIFQHMNLEVGPHHIEVDWGGYQPIAFDVYVRPGETTTFRADRY